MPPVAAAFTFGRTVTVEPIDDTLERVTGHGDSAGMEPTHIPDVGWHAYGTDAEGNGFGVVQSEAPVS